MTFTTRFASLRWLGLTVALLFFTLQSASFFHNAEHAFHKHEHAGKACEVYEYCNNLTAGDAPPVAPLITILARTHFQPAPKLFSLVTAAATSAAQPRAPPHAV